MKTLNGSGVFRSIFCHCKVGHFIVGQVIGVLSSLIASSPCMASEASRERTVRASKRQSRVRRFSWKFSFLVRLEEAQYHWLKNVVPSSNFDYDITGWPALNVCCTFKNAMRTKIGKVMITPFSGKKDDHSLLLWLVNDFWGLCGCIFYRSVWISISRVYKPANQNSEKGLPGKHCHAKSHRVCCV